MVNPAPGTLVPGGLDPHSQYRKLTITINVLFRNPNPPHIFNESDQELEKRMTEFIEGTIVDTLPYNYETGKGFIIQDFIAPGHLPRVSVKARECDKEGGRTLWEAIRYLLRGRYSR